MPFSDKAYPRIVFAPLSRWSEVGIPDLVYIFANPDQISALVTMQGFHKGKAVNTLAPFGAACHSIVYAAEQLEKEEPMAIMGLFDISQRSVALKNYLSMTLTYGMWEDMLKDLDKNQFELGVWFENCKELIRCIPLLQHDDKNPNDVATEPHDITHAPDALRYLLDGRPSPAEIPMPKDEDEPLDLEDQIENVFNYGL